ncbi:uncharacterized protein LOC127160299 [Labeo rohita]|uniref:uncharacterized protein LOC127160299 n=1 Tax=Labeo rohita TaxID=84645 RepID=UPI0021E1CB4A|nr:uncharacterized protein LOC127160299 [Labeo rohita]
MIRTQQSNTKRLYTLKTRDITSCVSGTSGVDDAHVFISSGKNVRLPCNNALHDCTSTTWTYSRHSAAVELITLGIKKENAERHERLSLGSDCSLNINNIIKEDYGFYTCQQWTGVNGPRLRPDSRVYLHVLHVSSSSSQTEISAGSSVTLYCQLFSYSYTGVSCDDLIRSEGIQLFWVNQAGVNLTISDPGYQISAPGHCIITLTTTLLNEDDNREWRCEVTHRNEVKTSVTYTVKSSAQDKTRAVTVTVISVSVAAFTVFLLVVLWLICRKRADNKRGTYESVVKGENEDKVTYETINMSIPAAARDNEQTDDVTYSEVSSSSKKPVKSLNDHNDTVTYAAIR